MKTIRASGRAMCWGNAQTGRLGAGFITEEASSVPMRVAALDDAVSIAACAVHSCAVRESGAVVCWGNGRNGRLGDGRPYGSTPQPVRWPGH